MLKINAYGLCEKCKRLRKPYFILKSKKSKKVLCEKHLMNENKKRYEQWLKIRKLKEDKKKELEILKRHFKQN